MQHKIFQLIFKQGYTTFKKESNQATLYQLLLLNELLTLAKNTQFGKRHDFKEIQTIQDFKNNVPIQTYESLESDILKMMDGQKNVLWPGKIKMFAKSSGTSNAKSKYIPLSKISLQENHFKGGKNILNIFSFHFPKMNIFKAKNLSVAGSFDENEFKVGDLSALLLDNLPPWVQMQRLPSKKMALLKNWEEKIEKISEEIYQEDVASLSGVPSWNLILLQKALQKSNKKTLAEMWPNFQMFMHGGVNFKPYKNTFIELIGKKDFVFLETYNASEGFFAIQDQFDEEENGMLLLCNHAIFYEFLPLENLNLNKPKTLQLNEVELNKNYALLISTKSGLWRYKIGDTIQFVSINPYRIKITGRLKYFINIFGEELIEDNANKALTQVCKELACEIAEYTVAPIFPNEEGKGAHEWLIEFVIPPSDLDVFSHQLDLALKCLNSDYEAKRTENLILQMPVINVLIKGTFYNWMKSKNKLGAQHKVPRLQNHRMIAEEILNFV